MSRLPEYDSMKYAYPSRRGLVYGKKGMVCTSQPLAAQVGLDILKQGGNAVDAAVAAAICMTVVEPMSNNVGGDAFALVWIKDQLHGLNGSGPAPGLADGELLRKQGFTEMPLQGMVPLTVPGAPAAWLALSERFGKLPFEQLFQPAIRYAKEGFPVTPVISLMWQQCLEKFQTQLTGKAFEPWFQLFAPEGRAPFPGELWRSPEMAETLEKLAGSRCGALYGTGEGEGALAEKIGDYSQQHDGFLRKEDFHNFRAEWVKPIRADYRGYDVWEIPPNGHGIAALMALNILKGWEFDGRDHVETYHRQIEAMKLAYADGKRYVSDPSAMRVTVEQLLSEQYAAQRRELIGSKAIEPEPGRPDIGGTIYLCTADEEGNMVSFIQSIYHEFGSGIVVPGTGICLQNRGANFSLDPASENCLAPGKKSYHTIIPGFLSKDGQAIGPFGVMGGFMQPQGHVQVIMNTIDFHMNPQEALDAPRWRWMGHKEVHVERGFPSHIIEGLLRRGHHIRVAPDFLDFGRGQIIWRTPYGTYEGATEPRADGTAAPW